MAEIVPLANDLGFFTFEDSTLFSYQQLIEQKNITLYLKINIQQINTYFYKKKQQGTIHLRRWH